MADDWKSFTQQVETRLLNASLTHARNEELTRELAQRESSITEIQRRMNELEQQNHQLHREKEELTNELVDMASSIEELQQRISGLDHRNENLINELDVKTRSEEEALCHCERLEHQNGELQRLASELQLQNGNLTNRLSEQVLGNGVLENENTHWKEQATEQLQYNERLQEAHTAVTMVSTDLYRFARNASIYYRGYAVDLQTLCQTEDNIYPYKALAKRMLDYIKVNYEEREHLWKQVVATNMETVAQRQGVVIPQNSGPGKRYRDDEDCQCDKQESD